MSINKIILRTSAITLALIAIFVGFTFSILTMFFPKIVANFALDLGLNKVAINYLEKTYQNTQDINDLYILVNQSHLNNYNNTYIKYYEILENYEKYPQFIDYINDKNLSSSTNKLTLSALINEDNYLKNNYVNALLNTNKLAKALNYSYNNFNYENYNLNNLGVYTFGKFLTNEYLKIEEVRNFLLQNYKDTNDSLINNIYNYFNESFIIFENNKNTTDTNRQIHLIALATRLNTVAIGLNNVVNNGQIENNINLSDVQAKVYVINLALSNFI